MKDISLDEFVKKGDLVSSFSLSGFDIKVVTSSGESYVIPNGLTEALFDNVEIKSTDGKKIGADELIAAIPNIGHGYESIYLDDLLAQQDVDDQSDLAKDLNLQLNNKNQKLEELMLKLEGSLEQTNSEVERSKAELAEAEKI